MRAAAYFIVEVEDTYNNLVEFEDGTKYSVNNSIDSVEHINRVGKIISAPKGSKVSPGDMLLFHHNICRETWGYKGKRRKSNFAISDTLFFIPFTEVFMYMKEGGDRWISLDPFVFVKPLEVETQQLSNGLEVEEDSYKGMKPLMGEIAFVNEELTSLGVKEGDIVAFQQDSEHEYKIKGEVFYKMRTQDILGVI